MPRLALLTVSFLALAGCSERNSQFCDNPKNANDPTCKSGGPCTTDTDCTSTSGFPVCDTNATSATTGTCVLCTATDHSACTGMTPRCENLACVACVDDSDCGAAGVGVCLPNGSCADPNSIIHATVNGSMSPGCGDVGNACTLTNALMAVTLTKNVIKLDEAGPYTSDMNNIVVNTDAAIELTIDARGAVVHSNTDGAILTINSNKATNKPATILGGTIEGATGSGGDGIQCNANATLNIFGTAIRTNEESAINAGNCTLTVTGADIRNNSTKTGSTVFSGIVISAGSITLSRSTIVSNRGGGISIANNGKFEVVGNVFLSNGDSGVNVSGVSISTTTSGNRLEFNTITQNKSDMTHAAGVQCSAPNFTAQNNIIWNNNSTLGINGMQVNGCSYMYSDIGPAFIPILNDHNLIIDPSFVNDTNDLHLQPGSMVRGKANPGANLIGTASKDMDGKPRVQPADLGAYVAPPQQ